jgi:hypothetical protein
MKKKRKEKKAKEQRDVEVTSKVFFSFSFEKWKL